jgi:hypothetical protein
MKSHKVRLAESESNKHASFFSNKFQNVIDAASQRHCQTGADVIRHFFIINDEETKYIRMIAPGQPFLAIYVYK